MKHKVFITGETRQYQCRLFMSNTDDHVCDLSESDKGYSPEFDHAFEKKREEWPGPGKERRPPKAMPLQWQSMRRPRYAISA